MTLSNIFSIIAVLLSVILVGWVKIISARAFKSIDDKIVDLHSVVTGLDLAVRKIEQDIIRLDEFKKSVDKDIKYVKADFIRETQVMNNQLDVVHGKIDHIDNKLDKLRDSRSQS